MVPYELDLTFRGKLSLQFKQLGRYFSLIYDSVWHILQYH